MTDPLDRFEQIVRKAAPTTGQVAEVAASNYSRHPFDERNIHPDLPVKVRTLYDDGHYSEAVFAAFKFVEKEVKTLSGIKGKTGYQLMTQAFGSDPPAIRINAGSDDSELDERRGFRDLFAGASVGIRNPRGHEVGTLDGPDESLDYLALASLLLRRLDAAGLRR